MDLQTQAASPKPQDQAQQDFNEAERFIGSGYGYMNLGGVHNARDLGGMPAADGKVICPGRLLRSGELERAHEGDLALLKALGVEMVVDFRTEAERATAPDPEEKMPWASFENLRVVEGTVVGITMDAGLGELISSAHDFEQHAPEHMSQLYAQMLTSKTGRAAYKRFFELVLEVGQKGAGHAILWHCTAGKDRTGIAAALLETALGVSHNMMVEDYLASERYSEPHFARELERLGHHGVAPKLGQALSTFYGVREQNLVRAYEKVVSEWGSVWAYMDSELGMDSDAIQYLRQLYLVEPKQEK